MKTEKDLKKKSWIGKIVSVILILFIVSMVNTYTRKSQEQRELEGLLEISIKENPTGNCKIEEKSIVCEIQRPREFKELPCLDEHGENISCSELHLT